MSLITNPSENQLVDAVVAVIKQIIPGAAVVRGLVNRVAPPRGDFIEVTPLRDEMLSTARVAYADPTPTTGTQTIKRPVKWSAQIDCYGSTAHDRAIALAIVMRSAYGVATFAAIDAQPLDTSDPQQLPYTNGEHEYEERWMFTAILQANLAVIVPQQFADQLSADIVVVSVEYPA